MMFKNFFTILFFSTLHLNHFMETSVKAITAKEAKFEYCFDINKIEDFKNQANK